MAIRVIKSCGDVYADLGIKRPATGRVGSNLKAEDLVVDVIAREESRKRLRAGKQKAKGSKPSAKTAVGKKARERR